MAPNSKAAGLLHGGLAVAEWFSSTTKYLKSYLIIIPCLIFNHNRTDLSKHLPDQSCLSVCFTSSRCFFLGAQLSLSMSSFFLISHTAPSTKIPLPAHSLT
ncbi:hypothetical protein CHARACLAT_023939 [Characodon lateralis]|uniref:Uncharacterized protein n=1 Tax=Characodon lateralis TaxID=208331 RepID=A0ABU7EDS4_9TELE|nr:hypothetical protein [Characodon lateralis]